MTTEKKNPVVSTVAQPSFDAAIRASKDDTKFDYNQRMAARGNSQFGQQPQQAVPTPTSTTERSMQTTADGGRKQVVKTTSPIRTADDVINAESTMGPGQVARVNQPVVPPAEFPGLSPTSVLERSVAGKMGRGLTSAAESVERNVVQPFEDFYQKNIKYPVESYLGEASTGVPAAPFAAPGVRPPMVWKDQPPQPVIDGGTQQRRLEQPVVVPTSAPASPQTAPPFGEREQFVLPGGQGVISAEPRTPGAIRGDELARSGVRSTAGQTMADIREMVETQDANQQMLNQEAIQRARSDESMQELEMQKSAGIVPRQGMAEYEQNAQRARDEAGLGPAQLAGVREARTGKEKEIYSQHLQNKAAVITAAGRTATETANQNIARQKVGVDVFNAGREAQYQDAQIAKWAHDMGSSEYDRQISQAKNDDDAAQINRTFGTKAIEAEFAGQDKAAEALLLTNPEQAQKDIAAIAQEKKKRFKELRLRHPTRGAIEGLPQKDAQGNDIEVPIQWDGKHWIEYKARGVV